MIVCVCHAVCERKLEALVAAGADTPEKLQRACGAGSDCGACRPEIEQIIERSALAPRLGTPLAVPIPAEIAT